MLFSERGLPPANLERWKELRKITDERTKTLLTSLERARVEYDRKVYDLTDLVRPFTEEEIASGIEKVGDTPELRSLRSNITSSVETFQVCAFSCSGLCARIYVLFLVWEQYYLPGGNLPVVCLSLWSMWTLFYAQHIHTYTCT
jgi:hypothetical protein